MAKHRRFSDASKPDSVQEDQEIELAEQKVPSKETSTNTKSILLSGTKYVYIVAAVALLSGIFTPLTIGAEFELVAMGMVSVFLGLGGGITIFLGLKNQKFTTLMICSGLGAMIISLIFIYELAERPLF
jgi:hypothetical protein